MQLPPVILKLAASEHCMLAATSSLSRTVAQAPHVFVPFEVVSGTIVSCDVRSKMAKLKKCQTSTVSSSDPCTCLGVTYIHMLCAFTVTSR
eukprot:5631857-Amphidinium_carterae.1